MNDWRARLRSVVETWKLSPEEQIDIVSEIEQHLEELLAELTPQIGATAANERILMELNDPALRNANVRPVRPPAPSVQLSRTSAFGWNAVVRDVRFAWRSLFVNVSTSLMAVAALALGIGLTTVMFSVVYGLILRGLPFENGDRIAMVMEANPSRGEPELALSMHDFTAYRDGQRSFESFGAFMPAVSINISGDDRPERVQAARVTAATLALTHVRPALGRAFTSLDDAPDGDLSVVLSHSLWRDHYASDSAVIGRDIRVNGQSSTIVGVMPDGFAFPNETKLWLPLRLNPASAPWGTGTHVNAVGRLRPGVTMQQAMTELRGIAARLERDHPGDNTGIRPVVQPFIRGVLPMRVYSLLYAMLAAVSLVLLIACTNVANLLLARAIRRRKEVALRAALGASRAALLRQFLAEALVLSLIAAVCGAIVADFGIALVRRALSTQAPFWTDIRLHPQVLLFTACVALVSSIVAGVLPALAAARSDITEVLKDQSVKSRSAGRGGALSRSLVIFELVLSSALLVTAALIT
ncbi:MAG TPA: ABC transporter permease, partial [Gemmatimonadaceae bacterium]